MSKMVLPALLALSIASVTSEASSENGNGFYVGVGASAVKLRADDDTESSLNFKNGLVQIGYAFSEHFAIEGQYTSSLRSESAVTIDQPFDVTPYVKQGLTSLNSLTNSQIAEVRSVKVNAHATADINLESLGIYGVYRTSGNLYAKIKGGPVSVNVKGKPNAKLTWTKDVASTASPTITDYIKSFETDFSESFYDSFDSSSGGDQSERETKFSVGVGVGYKIAKNFTSELEYTKLGEDVAKTSLTVNYSF